MLQADALAPRARSQLKHTLDGFTKLMSWEAIGVLAEVVGAATVVATLLYLGTQIAQTNRISRSTANRDVQLKYDALYTLVATDTGIADLAAKVSQKNYEPESEIERQKLDHLACLLASMWYSIQVSYEEGQMSEREYQIYCEDVVGRLKSWPGIAPYIRENIALRWPTAVDLPVLQPLYAEEEIRRNGTK